MFRFWFPLYLHVTFNADINMFVSVFSAVSEQITDELAKRVQDLLGKPWSFVIPLCILFYHTELMPPHSRATDI